MQNHALSPRLDPFSAAPQAIAAMKKLEDYTRHCGLPYSLIELVKVRASQLNGCGFCLHMHTRDARAAGETEERLYLLSAWQESPLFSDRERAALAWTEALTLVAEKGAPEEAYQRALAAFGEEDLVKLTLLIGGINIWNRIAIGFRKMHAVDENPHE